MSPRKSRQAAIQAAKSLTTAKKQPTRAKKKPEPKKVVQKKPLKSKNTSKKTNKIETTRETESNTDTRNNSKNTSSNEPKRKIYKRPNSDRRKFITNERLLSVINELGSTVGESSEQCIQTETEEIPLTQAVQEQENVENEEIEEDEQRTIYSCKFCNKDFSSAFILFLHIRIHEKVGSINEPAVQDESEQPVVEEKYIIEDDSDDEPEIKEEIIEEITIPDIDDDEEVKPEPENDPLQITPEPKTQFIGIINKNFVENLKKNLSLAMNKQVN